MSRFGPHRATGRAPRKSPYQHHPETMTHERRARIEAERRDAEAVARHAARAAPKPEPCTGTPRANPLGAESDAWAILTGGPLPVFGKPPKRG